MRVWVLCLAIVCDCGSQEQSLSFDFVLVSAYPATSATSAGVEGVVTITNHTSSDIAYTLPEFVGYEARDSSGTLVNTAAPVTSDPQCMCGPQTVTIAAGGSKSVLYGFNATNRTSWAFDTPLDPTKMGTDTPTTPVTPGVYKLTVVLMNGARTNDATVTVCRRPDGTNVGACNDPCSTQTLADANGAGTVSCGLAETCQ